MDPFLRCYPEHAGAFSVDGGAGLGPGGGCTLLEFGGKIQWGRWAFLWVMEVGVLSLFCGCPWRREGGPRFQADSDKDGGVASRGAKPEEFHPQGAVEE